MTGSNSAPRVLSVAGSDSGGGAGIQGDLKVITCLGAYGMSAVTALTAQDTRGVWGVCPVPPEFVARQIEVCLQDIGADAVKTGMLCNAPIIRAAAELFRRFHVANLVVDPVMVSTSGHRLLEESAERTLMETLLPLARVVTPNLSEASRLAGLEVKDMDSMRRAAKAIHALGPRAVIVKGGHLPGAAIDLLYDGGAFVELAGERIENKNIHGAGCAFSAALAVALAEGRSLPDAARAAKGFVTEAIRRALTLGQGNALLNPLAAATLLRERTPT